MFTIAFVTERWAPSRTVELRWGPNWNLDRGRVHRDGAWEFDLDEAAFPNGISFKFFLDPQSWEQAPNRTLDAAACVGRIAFAEAEVEFAPPRHAVVESGVAPQEFFVRNLDPQAHYDVIVVGSWMGGGLLASRLAGAGGANVLVLEAGSYLFPTHVGNLPQRLEIGRFDKHIWSLWQDFEIRNYVNPSGSDYAGAQGFNLGGRSLFWGGLIPRQSAWGLGAWPAAVRDCLLTGGYDAAEAALNRIAPTPTQYQGASRTALAQLMSGFSALDASLAVDYGGATHWSIPTGLFSTADLLMEDRLAVDPGHVIPTVSLNFAVWRVEPDPTNAARLTGVTGWDLLGQVERRFNADIVDLAAGTIESAKSRCRAASPTRQTLSAAA